EALTRTCNLLALVTSLSLYVNGALFSLHSDGPQIFGQLAFIAVLFLRQRDYSGTDLSRQSSDQGTCELAAARPQCMRHHAQGLGAVFAAARAVKRANDNRRN